MNQFACDYFRPMASEYPIAMYIAINGQISMDFICSQKSVFTIESTCSYSFASTLSSAVTRLFLQAYIFSYMANNLFL